MKMIDGTIISGSINTDAKNLDGRIYAIYADGNTLRNSAFYSEGIYYHHNNNFTVIVPSGLGKYILAFCPSSGQTVYYKSGETTEDIAEATILYSTSCVLNNRITCSFTYNPETPTLPFEIVSVENGTDNKYYCISINNNSEVEQTTSVYVCSYNSGRALCEVDIVDLCATPLDTFTFKTSFPCHPDGKLKIFAIADNQSPKALPFVIE